MDALERAIEVAGGLTELATLIEATPQRVNNWRARGRVPPESCGDIERAVDGKVTKHDLRPDIFEAPEGKQAAEARVG